MMPNILQYPVCLFGTLRAGCTVVNVNPLYTARELEHQLTDSGAEVIVVVENFARTVAEVLGRTKVRRVIVTSIGELLGFKGIVVDLVLRRVKKMIPAWSIPEAVRLSDALAAGRTRQAGAAPARARRHRVPAVHGRHDGRREGRGAAAPQHRRQPAAGPRVAAAVPEQRARDHPHAAAAVPHLLADRELPHLHDAGRREHPDPESARHTGLREGDGQVQVHGDHRRQHAVQRAC